MINQKQLKESNKGFTLLELITVLTITAIIGSVLIPRLNIYQYYQRKEVINELKYILSFAYSQAKRDSLYYQVRFDFKNNTYQVGMIQPDSILGKNIDDETKEVGLLTLELTNALISEIDDTYMLIPPSDFPSLGEPRLLSPYFQLKDIILTDGKHTADTNRYINISCSPLSVCDFAVIHLIDSANKYTTILFNPFTGMATVKDGYYEYRWTYQEQ